MFSQMIKSIKCEICGHKLRFSQSDTFQAWQDSDIFRLDDIDKLIDGVISDILVLICDNCEITYRYTFKELEKIFRKKLSDQILTMIAKSDLPDPGSMKKTDRLLVYCGKCNGHDGKGACPRMIYDKCELKRLPKNGC